MFYRPTWAEIDLNALIHNYRYVLKHVYPKKVIPVIKADAYGHGSKEVMRALIDEGVQFFLVSLLEEALELREISQDVEILVLGPILESQFELCYKHNIQFTVYDVSLAKQVLSSKLSLRFHIKVDTGMHRYGLSEVIDIINLMNQVKHTKHEITGIYSHFATANEQDALFFKQIKTMEDILSQLPYLPKMIHISNSSASLRYEEQLKWTTHVRLGISLYGLSLDKDQKGLLPVMSLKTRIVEIKELNANETVGYGATYHVAKEHERIAVIPIGYADGWIRKNKNGFVEINHKLYRMVGIICMDACFVKVDDIVSCGDEVTLFGGLVSIDDVAKRLNTISYEVVCQISKRVPRLIKKEE